MTGVIERLNERRKTLESGLKEVVSQIVEIEIKESIQEPLKTAGIKVVKIAWEFYPESDDEGGTNYYPEHVQVFNVDGGIDEDDLDGIMIKDVRSYGTYDTEVLEFIHDILCNHSSDLYDCDIEEIIFEEVTD